MKQTRKYTGACKILTIPHATQDQLYQELNRLGWFWDSKAQEWKRDDRVSDPPSKLIRIRVWAATERVEEISLIISEAVAPYGLLLQERSDAYVCRPPQNNDSRIYLTFIMDEE